MKKNRTHNPSRLLRVKEAATLLAVSTRTLWAMTNSGQIPCVRLGRSVRYDPGDLDRTVERHKKKGPQRDLS